MALTVKEFTEKYNKFKKRMAYKINHGNPEDVIRNITEKARNSVNKDMQSYDLVKEIEGLLSKREQKRHAK